MAPLLKYASLASVIFAASACTIAQLDQLESKTATPISDPFAERLAMSYRHLGAYERDAMLDFPSAEHYGEKGLAAVAGNPPPPDRVEDRKIPNSKVAELKQAREKLVAAFDAGAKTASPDAAAIAQANYDCWLEQQEENYQPNHIKSCRDAFQVALARLETQPPTTTSTTGPEYLKEPIIVYFDFDKADIDPAAREKLQRLAQDVQKHFESYSLVAYGHTDTVGSEEYNRQLSTKRADAVKQALVSHGIPADRIRTVPRGETNPEVPTAEGVRAPANRRVYIEFQEGLDLKSPQVSGSSQSTTTNPKQPTTTQ